MRGEVLPEFLLHHRFVIGPVADVHLGDGVAFEGNDVGADSIGGPTGDYIEHGFSRLPNKLFITTIRRGMRFVGVRRILRLLIIFSMPRFFCDCVFETKPIAEFQCR